MDFILIIGAVFILMCLAQDAERSRNIKKFNKKLEKEKEKADKERFERYRSDSTQVHSDALRTYVRYLDQQKNDFRHLGQSEAIGGFLSTESILKFGSEFSRYLERSGLPSTSWKSVSEMQGRLTQVIARDEALSKAQIEFLTANVGSALSKYLTEEAETQAKEQARLRAEENEKERQAAAAREQIAAEQRMLSTRLNDLYLSAWNEGAGLLPIEVALQTEMPNQHCYVYRVDVGGESYVGYTTATPEAAMSEHETRSRRGSMAPLHKALRRFGCVYETAYLSERDDEVRGLLERLVQIKKLMPTLNAGFEGDGDNFRLVERENEYGEKVFFVENMRVSKVHNVVRRRSDKKYLRGVLEKLVHRYKKIENRIAGGGGSSVMDAHAKAWIASAGELSSSKVVAFAYESRKVLAAAIDGHRTEL